LRPPRLDFGSRFETDRIADEVPPIMGKPFETLVPKPDADGLDEGGIALPELLAPLGTRTGFNTRNDSAGFPWASGRWDGSFVPFPRTERERQASGDPRLSLEARYANRAAYEAKVRSAAADVVGRGFLLPEDVDALVGEAGGLYDRIMAHDPVDRSCDYLFGR
jgi:Alpha/beta hydrolase domain